MAGDYIILGEFPSTAGIADADIIYSASAATGNEQKVTAKQLQTYALNMVAAGTNTQAGALTGNEILPLSQSGGLFQSTLSTIAAWIVNAFQGYAPNATGGTNRSVASKFLDRVSVKDFGATGNGVTDDTTAIQNAISYVQQIGGGVVFFPAGTYLVSTTLNVTANGVTLQGDNRIGTVINFTNAALDCLTVIGQNYANPLYGFEMKDLYFNHTSKTGGRSIVLAYVSQVAIRDVTLSNAWTGVEIWVANNVVFDNFYMAGATGGAAIPATYYGGYAPKACYGIWWHAPGDNSASSNQLTTIATTLQLSNSGADGFVWDGLCQNWHAVQTAALGCRYGLHILNSALSPSYYPGFGEFSGFNTGSASSIGVLIEAGRTFKFINSTLSNSSGGAGGSSDTNAVRILADAAASVTASVCFTNCKIGNSAQGAFYSAARDVIVNGCTVLPGTTTTTNTYPGIEIASPAQDVIVSNSKCYEWGVTNQWKYLIQADAGTTRVLLANNNLAGVGTRGILWNNTDLNSNCVGNISSGVARPSPSSQPLANGALLTAAWLLGGALNVNGPTAAWSAVTDTAADIVAALANPGISTFHQLVLINSSAYPLTVTAGAGVGLVGNTLTIPANSQRVLTLNITNCTLGSEAVTIYA
jgi:hypothetical protein